MEHARTFKGLEFDVELVPKKGGEMPAWFLEVSPEDEVPVLMCRKERGGPLVPACPEPDKSAPVLAWLDVAYADKPLLVPGDAAKRELVQKWASWVDSTLKMAIVKTIMVTPFPMQQKAQANLNAALAEWDAALKEHNPGRGPYFFGDTMTLVDVLAAPFLARVYEFEYFRDYKPDAERFPDAEAYRAGLREWPQFRDHIWSREDLHEELKGKVKPMPPLSVARLQHVVFRRQMRTFVAEAKAAAAEPTDAKCKRVGALFDTWLALLDGHSNMEEQVVYPKIEELQAGATASHSAEHAHEIPERSALAAALGAVVADSAEGSPERAAAMAKAADELAALAEASEAHFKGEEANLFPLTSQFDKATHPELFKRILEVETAHAPQSKWLPAVLTVLPGCHRGQYVLNYWNASQALGEPSLWTDMVAVVKDYVAAGDGEYLPKEVVDDIAERVPQFGEAMAAGA